MIVDLSSLAQNTCTLYTFSSLMHALLPKGNLIRNIFTEHMGS